MPRQMEDLTGRRYCMLTVIQYDYTDRNGDSRWLCKCDCGNPELVSVKRHSLQQGMTTSCGCKRRGIKDDLIGRRFDRLTVVEFVGRDLGGRSRWRCRCDCGGESIADGYNLKSGQVRSCGCLQRAAAREAVTRHGMSDSRLYRIWSGMHQRCENQNMPHYSNYGGRGISVCDEWSEFENFRNWALSHGYSDDLTIDRSNNNLNYSPNNCRWADVITQQNNTRKNHHFTYGDETKTIAEWSRCLGIRYSTLWQRISRGDLDDFERYFNGED